MSVTMTRRSPATQVRACSIMRRSLFFLSAIHETSDILITPLSDHLKRLHTFSNFEQINQPRQCKYTLIKIESQRASKRQGIDCRNSARAANDSCDINASAVIRKNSMGIFNARIDE